MNGNKAAIRATLSSDIDSKLRGRVKDTGVATFSLEKINGTWMITEVK